MTKKKNKVSTVGIIGTGWIGGTYANDLEGRGFKVVRYSLDPKYKRNKSKIKDCDYVMVAVPTPTTPDGFSSDIVEKCIKELTKKGQIIIIKSTLKIGTTDKIQKDNPGKYIFHCPEFLTESTARQDVEAPERNIYGYTDFSIKKVEMIAGLFNRAPYEMYLPAKEAEIIKYMGNCYFYAKNMMTNIFYDLAKDYKMNYSNLRHSVINDSRIGEIHTNPVHKGGRGAGNHCLIKDMATLREMYSDMAVKKKLKDGDIYTSGYKLLKAMENYNISLLKSSKKDLDLLEGVYGK